MDGVYVTSNTFPNEVGVRFKVQINTNDGQWLVLNDSTGIVEASGHHVRINQAKANVKKALEKLGVKFSKEERMGKVKKLLTNGDKHV